MEKVQERISKLREERLAREKARIEKLRELNLKKYKTHEKPALKTAMSSTAVIKRNTKPNDPVKNIQSQKPTKPEKTAQKPQSVLNSKPNILKSVAARVDTKLVRKDIKIDKKPELSMKNVAKIPLVPVINVTKSATNRDIKSVSATSKVSDSKITRKSLAPMSFAKPTASNEVKKTMSAVTRKSMIPTKKEAFKSSPKSQSAYKPNQNRQSVFDRLYKPKMVNEKHVNDVQRLHTDSKFRDKIMKQSGLITNKRQTTFDNSTRVQPPVRRSISAVHFKRIGKNELNDCFHKWSSIGENIDKIHLTDLNEDAKVKADIVVSAVKSDRKKVHFQKPISMNFNTPRPSELQSRLKNWLQKRGKSLESYHHLHCFGLNHLANNDKEFKTFDDENKENIALESDSDNDSYCDNMNNKGDEKWRRASYVSSTDFDETKETINSEEVTMHNVDELLVGALNNVTDLLREGYDWQQCARWLRAVRERFPSASDTAAYWECRAALEEAQDNLPASVQCWEEAIAKGTETSVVEANLDHLLDKFMQLRISPQSAKKSKTLNPKMLDVKNVFKSTIIRFAVQQAKLRQSIQPENTAKYIITPVRRSTRLSYATPTPRGRHTPATRAPLVQICDSIRHISSELARDAKFVPNETLPHTP